MFHLTDGLYFQQLPEGAVRILKQESGREDAAMVFDITIDANQWSSVIASMSYYGEENSGFYRALHFHRGDLPPVGVEFAVAPGIAIGSVTSDPWKFKSNECGYDPAIDGDKEWPHHPGPFPGK